MRSATCARAALAFSQKQPLGRRQGQTGRRGRAADQMSGRRGKRPCTTLRARGNEVTRVRKTNCTGHAHARVAPRYIALDVLLRGSIRGLRHRARVYSASRGADRGHLWYCARGRVRRRRGDSGQVGHREAARYEDGANAHLLMYVSLTRYDMQWKINIRDLDRDALTEVTWGEGFAPRRDLRYLVVQKDLRPQAHRLVHCWWHGEYSTYSSSSVRRLYDKYIPSVVPAATRAFAICVSFNPGDQGGIL